MERRLATIVAADVVGYSARMFDDEADTIRRLEALRSLAEDCIARRSGRVFSRAGDGLLAEFQSPVSAVRASYELQRALSAREARATVGLQLRIGIHLADVVVDGADLLGDGVNVACRIEGLANAGAVFLSKVVFDQVKRSAQLTFDPKGSHQLKNISEPVEIYAVIGELGAHSCASAMGAGEALAPAVAQGVRPNSVVVVPFKNMSGDPEQEYFADGFTDDLITELSRFSDLFVISRNASFCLKGVNENGRQIGRNLGARFCLEGGIRKLGERIRITSHLLDTESGEQIWSERNDCIYAELFDVQDDLVAKIVAAVFGRIERQVDASAQRKRPAALEAYDCCLRGLELHRVGGVTRENAQQALQWFDRALEKDPKYGRAHAWRACAMATLAEWDGNDVWDELCKSGRLAVELDETDAEAHRIVGSLSLYQRDFARAEHHFTRALELNPNHAFIVGRMGELYNFLGDGRRALEFQTRAKTLDPFLPEYCRELEAVAHYVLGQYRACCQVVDEFSRLTRRAAAYRAAAAQHLDDAALLRRSVQDLFTLDPNFAPNSFVATEFYRDPKFRDLLKADLKAACAAQVDYPTGLAAGVAGAEPTSAREADTH